jgi:hypothetical protein
LLTYSAEKIIIASLSFAVILSFLLDPSIFGSNNYTLQSAYAQVTWSAWKQLDGNITGDPSIFPYTKNAESPIVFILEGKDNESVAANSTGGHNLWYKVLGSYTYNWIPLDGNITSQIAVGQNADGRLEVFGGESEQGVSHTYQLSAIAPAMFPRKTDSWSEWKSLGGGVTGNPSVGKFKDGRLAVFVIGGLFDAYYKVQTAPNNDTWSNNWIPLGGKFTGKEVAVANNADGSLQIFAAGGGGRIYTNSQTAPNSSTWSGWKSLGGSSSNDPSVGIDASGRLVIFYTDRFFDAYYKVQTAPNSDTWSNDWIRSGQNIAGKITAIRFMNELYLFARTADNSTVYGIYGNQPIWSDWRSLGGSAISNIVANIQNHGQTCEQNEPILRVFAGRGEHGVWYRQGCINK